MKPPYYRTVNLKEDDFAQLNELATLLGTKYARLPLGKVVAQLIAEKLAVMAQK